LIGPSVGNLAAPPDGDHGGHYGMPGYMLAAPRDLE
jgi:hypothetical protein